jgi:trimeric autotransporter adhesin
MNLLYATGSNTPAETGLSIASNGAITATSFSGNGSELTDVTASNASELGGLAPSAYQPAGSYATTGSNSFAGNQTVTGSVTATSFSGSGSGLTGVTASNSSELGGLASSAYAQLAAASNIFMGSQTVDGTVTAAGLGTAGTVSGGVVNATTSFDILNTPFAFGSVANGNALLGFAGSSAITGTNNTASGYVALEANTTGSYNTASGAGALLRNTTGGGNTATGYGTLELNCSASAACSGTQGIDNTATGAFALNSNTTGSYNTALGSGALGTTTTGGYNTALGSQTNVGNFSNSTAIGAHAEVTADNAMVLGSINQTNGATADTLVGIGTTAPAAKLHVSGVEATQNGKGAAVQISNTSTGGANYYLRVGATGTETAAAGFSIANDNLYVMTITSGGQVGIQTQAPTNIFTIKQTAGDAIADGWSTYSSRRWKTNIEPLHNALGTVERLRGVSYNLKANGKHEVGVIAEEVGAVVPEVVTYEENGKDARAVDYTRLTALLIEATKEQQALIRKQQAQITRLTRQVNTIQASLKANQRSGSAVRTLQSEATTVRP